MSRARLAGAAVIAIIMFQAVLVMRNQLALGDQVQLDLTLKLRSPSGDMEYIADYHWGATEIGSSTSPSSRTNWISRSSHAGVHSSDNLTNAIRATFSSVSIETDYFSLNRQGDWSLSIQKKLCDGVFLDLDAEGDNTTVTHLTPSLSVAFVPLTLSSALDRVGIDYVDVIVTISLHIMGEVVEQYFRICFEVFMGYVELAMDVANLLIGAIYTG